MTLTPKREKFVQGLVAGLSQRQAYIQAYSTKNMKDATIDNNAYKLMQINEVSTRYKQLMDEHKVKALFTREEAVKELIWLYNQSKKSIEEQDEGYVRQGTSGAMLGALDRLIALELLDPISQLQREKLRLENLKLEQDVTPSETTENKLLDYFKALQEVYLDD